MKLKNREKILIVLAFVAIAVWVFDSFYYTPQSRKIQRLKAEVLAANLKLNESLVLTKGVETLETEVLRQEGELKRLSERILRGEEFRSFLKHLAKECGDPFQMKLISLTPREEKLTSLEGNKETSPAQYKKVSIHMVFHATYAKLETYLKGIEELPFLIHVDSIQVEEGEEIQPLLKVTMGLSMYIISS
jgi:hypothetical protein